MSRGAKHRGGSGAASAVGGGARRLPPSLTAEDLSDDRRQIQAKIRRHQAIKTKMGGHNGPGDDQSTMYDPSLYDPSVYTNHTDGLNSQHTDNSGGTNGTNGTYGSKSRSRAARRGSGGGGGGGGGGGSDHEGTESVVSALESFMMKAPWAKRGGGGVDAAERTVASNMTFGTNRSGSTTGTGSSFQPRLPAVAGAQAQAAQMAAANAAMAPPPPSSSRGGGGGGGGGGGPSPNVTTEDYALNGGGGPPRRRSSTGRRRQPSSSANSAADLELQMIPQEYITLKKLRVRIFLSVMYLLVSVSVVLAFGFFMVGQKMSGYGAWPTAAAAQGQNEGVAQEEVAGGTAGATGSNGPTGPGEDQERQQPQGGVSGAGRGQGNDAQNQHDGRTHTAALNNEGARRMAAFKPLFQTISGGDALEVSATPQYQALHWLSYEDSFNATPPAGASTNDPAVRKLIQRYALATLFHATGGPARWKDVHHFLTPDADECEWNSIDPATRYFSGAGGCDDTGMVTTLALWENGLGGSLNDEIGELSALQVLSLYGNDIRGGVPEAWGKLTNLDTLYLHGNAITADLTSLCSTPAWSDMANARADCHAPADDEGLPPMVTCPCCNVCCAASKDSAGGVDGGVKCYQREE